MCTYIYIGWRIYVYMYIYRVAYLCVHIQYFKRIMTLYRVAKTHSMS